MCASPADLLLPISPLPRLRDVGSRRAALDSYIGAFNKRAVELGSQLHSGAIGVDAWQLAMRAELKTLHVNALVISRGGEWGAITQSEWGRLGAYVRGQYNYLYQYAQAVQKNALEALSGGKFYSEKYLIWRSKLYGGNARASFYRGLAYGLLEQVPADGQTQCGSNCQCELRFEEGDQPGLLLVYWELRPAEHCDDCVKLSETWNPLELWLPMGLSAREWVTWLPKMGAYGHVAA